MTKKLPGFDFVHGILDVINGIEAVAEEYPEFHNAFTKGKLADTRELLEKRDAEHNPTIAR